MKRHEYRWLFGLSVAVTMVSYPAASLAMTWEDLRQEAFELAQTPFVVITPESMPAFDPPAGSTELGLDYHEYLALLTKRPFVDDGYWWLKQRPRGNVEREPLQIGFVDAGGRSVQQLPYAAEDYVYVTNHISPPLPVPLPKAAQVITALAVGHRQFDRRRWPQVFHIGGNGYARLAGYNNEFSTSLRFGTHNAATDHEVFPRVTKLYIGQPGNARLKLFALIDSAAFTAAAHMHLTPGNRSVLRVESVLFPRVGVAVNSHTGTGPLAFSSMFWKGGGDTPADGQDQAHDADTFEYCDAAGKRTRLALTIPVRGAPPLQDAVGQASCFAVLQTERDPVHYRAYKAAQYERRADMRVTDVVSSVPYTVRLVRYFTDYEGHDNIVVFVAFAQAILPVANARAGYRFDYTVTASSN